MIDASVLVDTSVMRRVGGQIGSNPAGLFEDQDGCRYYVKTLESAAHARNEYLAAALYQLAGAPTLTYLRCQDPCQVATLWVQLEKKYIAHFSEPERRQATLWFGVHAWTANWDAAGFDGDNQGVANGVVLTLDLGGALAFRAQGDPKGRAFGTTVGELESMRSDPENPHARRLFGNMSIAELVQSMRVVTDISDTAIQNAIGEHGGSEKLVIKMLARKADMALRLPN